MQSAGEFPLFFFWGGACKIKPVCLISQWRKSRGGQGDTSPPNVGWGTVMHHVPPNMAEISLHKRQRIRLYLLSYVIISFLSNIRCLQLCQMFYRGQFCESDFQNLDHKQCRSPKFSTRFTPLYRSYIM